MGLGLFYERGGDEFRRRGGTGGERECAWNVTSQVFSFLGDIVVTC